MGYKVKSTVEETEKELMEKLTELGITIELPIEEEKKEENK